MWVCVCVVYNAVPGWILFELLFIELNKNPAHFEYYAANEFILMLKVKWCVKQMHSKAHMCVFECFKTVIIHWPTAVFGTALKA